MLIYTGITKARVKGYINRRNTCEREQHMNLIPPFEKTKGSINETLPADCHLSIKSMVRKAR